MLGAKVKKVAGCAVAAAAVSVGVCAALVSGAGGAGADVYPVDPVSGHAAFAVGPFGSGADCAPRAQALVDYGARASGASFGTCYFKNGAWWALSPWAA